MSQGQLEVVFNRTERQKCFSIQLFDDSAPEDDEMFQLLITSTSPVDSRMQLDLTTITITIVDDDISKSLLKFVKKKKKENLMCNFCSIQFEVFCWWSYVSQ